MVVSIRISHIYLGSVGNATMGADQLYQQSPASVPGHPHADKDLDGFCSTCRLPRDFTRFPPKFFQTRIVDSEGAHCKAFAGEVMTVLSLLVLFSEYVLEPENILGEHVRCLKMASEIADWLILAPEEAVVQHLDTIAALWDSYQDLARTLYHLSAHALPATTSKGWLSNL